MSKRMRRGGVVAAVAAAFLAVCVMVTSAWAVTGIQYADKPANGTTQGQPFAPGTGGSQNFRIPGIVTLNDGTIVACTDARWNHAGDGAGLDTIVSVSKDGGANWTYTFANYLGDNGNTYNNQSTSFIDPAIATDGETVYLVADLFPAGIALNTSVSKPVAGKTGFTDDGTGLILRENDNTPIDGSYGTTVAAKEYNYYLNLKDRTIRQSDGTLVEGYEVDAYFNITETATDTTTNLFCADAPFQVYPTDYLYMTTSTDGLDWSAPTLINVKEPDEQTLLVGPGNGLVLEDGTLVFSVYDHTGGYERAAIIWRDKETGAWKRSADATSDTSSEATAVQIDENTIRQFYRDTTSTLRYTDYTLDDEGNWVPGTPVDTGMTKRASCQISAIKHSEKVDGKDAIIVSLATNTNERAGGKLYVGLVNDDESHTMEWRYAYAVNGINDYYAYSCLTELHDEANDGSIGLLYESAGSQETFVIITPEELMSNKSNLDYIQSSVVLDEGETGETINDPSGDYTDADVSSLDPEVATVAIDEGPLNETLARVGSAAGVYEGTQVDLSDCEFTFTASGNNYDVTATDASGNMVYLDPAQGSAGFPVKTSGVNKITVSAGHEAGSVYLRDTAGSYLFFYKNSLQLDRVNNLGNNTDWMSYCSALLYRPVSGGEASSTELPGYVQVSDFSNLSGQYLIAFKANNGNYYVLYPSTSTAHKSAQAAQVIAGGPSTNITFTGVAPGETGVLIGETYYSVTVNKVYDFIPSTDITATAGSEVSDGDASATEGKIGFAFDNKTNTYWHSSWTSTTMENLWVTMELQQATSVESLQYLPRQTSSSNGTVTEATIQCSNDGKTWHDITTVEWPNSGNKDWRIVDFETPIIAKYFRLQGVHTYADSGNDQFMSAAEIRLAKGPEVDQSALNAALSKAEDLVEEDYTPESWASFEDALAAANEALFIADTEAANAAAQALETAITNLVSAEQPEITGDNVALKKTAVSKTNESSTVASNNVTDGDTTATRWASAVDDKPTWIYVDLNGTYDVSAVKLFWQNRKALDYSIQVAADGADLDSEESWTTIQHEQNMPEDITETFIFDEATSARYVRILITNFQDQNPDDPSKSWNNVSIFELEVYGKEVEPAFKAPMPDKDNCKNFWVSVYERNADEKVKLLLGTMWTYGGHNFTVSFAGSPVESDGEWTIEATVDVSSYVESKLANYRLLENGSKSLTLTYDEASGKWLAPASGISMNGQKAEHGAAFQVGKLYSDSNRFEFPTTTDESSVLEFELGQFRDDEINDNGWPMEIIDQNGKKAVDAVKNGDFIDVPFTADVAGTYEVVLSYASGSASNGLSWSDEGDLVAPGDATAGATDEAAELHTVTFDMTVDEAGESTLSFGAKDSAGAPRLDKLTITLKDVAPETHTVTFEDGVNDPTTQTVNDGEKATKPADPTRTGYTFAGWFADGAEDAYDFDTTVTTDLTLTAHWTLNAPTVTVSADSENPTEGETVTLTASATHDLTEGITYTYTWTKDGAPVENATEATLEVTGSGTYVVTVSASDGEGGTSSATSEGVKVSFAEQTVRYTVTFDAGGGTPVPAQQTVESGSTVAKPATDPTRTGYNFLAWFTKDSQGTPQQYDFTAPVTSDLTLVAGWEFKAPDAELSVSLENPVEGDTVTITVTATHDLGDGVNYTYYWTHNGETIDGERDSTLEVTEPGRYGVSVNATDKSDPNARSMTGESIEVTFDPKPVDFSALVAAIADGTAIDTEGKTQDSADALRDALVAGEALLENLEATQEQVDDAAQAIRDAIANLEDESGTGEEPGDEPGTGEQPGDDQQGGSQKPGDTTKPGTGGSTTGGTSKPSGDGLAQTGDPATMAAALATALTGVAAVAAAKARRMK